MVLLDEFCVKVYFWPFLSYLASIKGWCPLYPPGYYPIYALPPPPQPPQQFPPQFPPPVPQQPTGPLIPLQPALPSTPAVIPTLQPTPPYPQTPSVTPPLITTSSSTTTSSTTTTTGVTTLSTAGTTLPLPVPTCPSQPLVCLPGGARPLPNCPCIDPRQQNSPLVSAPPGGPQIGSDIMVFMPLNAGRRRRRRRKRRILY